MLDFEVEEPFGIGELEIDGITMISPFIEVNAGVKLGRLLLHWGNTTVRCFYSNPEANHVELRFKKKLQGLYLPDEITGKMLEYKYPMRLDPFVDSESASWIGMMSSKEIDAELEDLLED